MAEPFAKYAATPPSLAAEVLHDFSPTEWPLGDLAQLLAKPDKGLGLVDSMLALAGVRKDDPPLPNHRKQCRKLYTFLLSCCEQRRDRAHAMGEAFGTPKREQSDSEHNCAAAISGTKAEPTEIGNSWIVTYQGKQKLVL